MKKCTVVRLASRPEGMPNDSNWKIEENELAAPGPDEVLLQTLYISIDPAMRGWMNDARSYIPPVRINEVMRALTLSRVVESNAPGFAPGDMVTGSQGVRDFTVTKAKDLTKVDPARAPLTAYLSALGMTGMTAYFGLLDVGMPKEGEFVVVSGAAGAVGQVVGQIAKIKGCTVIGIAGGEDKCKFLTNELGFHHAIDYKTQNVAKEIKRHARQGLDVYFDNVGGEILEAALFNLRKHARIVICGAISQYNESVPVGPRNYLSLLVNRARMEGMVVFDYADRYAQAVDEMAGWMKEGRLKSVEYVVKGTVRDFPAALLRIFKGENTGKLLLQVAE